MRKFQRAVGARWECGGSRESSLAASNVDAPAGSSAGAKPGYTPFAARVRAGERAAWHVSGRRAERKVLRHLPLPPSRPPSRLVVHPWPQHRARLQREHVRRVHRAGDDFNEHVGVAEGRYRSRSLHGQRGRRVSQVVGGHHNARHRSRERHRRRQMSTREEGGGVEKSLRSHRAATRRSVSKVAAAAAPRSVRYSDAGTRRTTGGRGQVVVSTVPMVPLRKERTRLNPGRMQGVRLPCEAALRFCVRDDGAWPRF